MTDYLDHYRGRTALISGGAGAIGSNLCRALSDLGAKVIVLDDLSSAHIWNLPVTDAVTFVRGSVTDDADLKNAFGHRPDTVFHLAAFFANQNSVEHPARDLETNGRGTLLMLQYAQLMGIDRFVYASSGCGVYGSDAPLPLQEDVTSLHLTTPYQVTKMLGELYSNYFHHEYDLPIVNARFFNSYGPGEVPGRYRNVIPNFIYWALSRQALPITGTGDETRDFTYVGDIVDGLLRAGYFEAAVGQAMNLAAGTEQRVIDLAERVNALTGNDA
ncbi:MAG: NAD-dependent epimerase/dehydratase family protein, partial [Aquihabitans sp.]